MRNKHRTVYLARKNFYYLFCKSIKVKEKIILKHNKKELFGYCISNYKSKYINEEYD